MNCRVAFDDFSRDAARARSAIISMQPSNYAEACFLCPVLPSVDRFKLFIDDEAWNKNRSYKTLGNNVERWEDGWDYRFGEEQACLSKLKSARVTRAIGNQSWKLYLI